MATPSSGADEQNLAELLQHLHAARDGLLEVAQQLREYQFEHDREERRRADELSAALIRRIRAG